MSKSENINIPGIHPGDLGATTTPNAGKVVAEKQQSGEESFVEFERKLRQQNAVQVNEQQEWISRKVISVLLILIIVIFALPTIVNITVILIEHVRWTSPLQLPAPKTPAEIDAYQRQQAVSQAVTDKTLDRLDSVFTTTVTMLNTILLGVLGYFVIRRPK